MRSAWICSVQSIVSFVISAVFTAAHPTAPASIRRKLLQAASSELQQRYVRSKRDRATAVDMSDRSTNSQTDDNGERFPVFSRSHRPVGTPPAYLRRSRDNRKAEHHFEYVHADAAQRTARMLLQVWACKPLHIAWTCVGNTQCIGEYALPRKRQG
jgi:hypothetical protein